MERGKFIEFLKDKNLHYREEGGSLIIDDYGNIEDHSRITSLPEGVYFENGGYVFFKELKHIPKGTVFRNGGVLEFPSVESISEGVIFRNDGGIDMTILKSLPKGIKFENHLSVFLHSVESISEGVEFKNGKSVWLDSMKMSGFSKGVRFYNPMEIVFQFDWKSIKIEGISESKCLNSMIENLFG
jgi:hypothetical protein